MQRGAGQKRLHEAALLFLGGVFGAAPFAPLIAPVGGWRAGFFFDLTGFCTLGFANAAGWIPAAACSGLRS